MDEDSLSQPVDMEELMAASQALYDKVGNMTPAEASVAMQGDVVAFLIWRSRNGGLSYFPEWIVEELEKQEGTNE